MTDDEPKRQKCVATVYVKDTYRRTGRGKSGFEMHYMQHACKRWAKAGEGYCWQHLRYWQSRTINGI